jgi:hypothetical protein
MEILESIEKAKAGEIKKKQKIGEHPKVEMMSQRLKALS